ncbi:MAG: cell division protein FtsL [Desulfosarcina sp.]|nr:cell division protein FtsL [Desulfobacterales bacterium]
MKKKQKKKKDAALEGRYGIYLTLLGVFILELFFFAWCRVQYVKTGYVISEETAKHQKLLSLQRNFKIERARLKSPERLSEIARSRLGLAAPETGQTIIIP